MTGVIERISDYINADTQKNVYYISGSDTLPPPLSTHEEKEIFSLLKTNSKRAKKILIERNLRLVVYIAKKFENTGVGIEDLISTGTIGLIKSINTFDPDKNIKLATYASRCVENEILMFLRKNTYKSKEVSLDEPLNVDWDGNELLLSDILGTSGDVVMKTLLEESDRKLLGKVIDLLPPREKQIISMRFALLGGKEKTQKEVADTLGISQSYISRLEKKIISRLKRELVRLE